MGLPKILALSTLSGLSFGFTYKIGGELSGRVGFVILDLVFENVDSRIQGLIMIISLVVTIFFIYGLTKFIRQVYEQQFLGMITAILGFSGSILVVTSTQESTYFIFLGMGAWVIGVFIVFFGNKKSKT